MSAETQQTFQAMKVAEQEWYEAGRKAEEARKAWERACRDKVLADLPELMARIAEVERLERHLDEAKRSMKSMAQQAPNPQLFRRWFE